MQVAPNFLTIVFSKLRLRKFFFSKLLYFFLLGVIKGSDVKDNLGI